jgi:hypothetical protein
LAVTVPNHPGLGVVIALSGTHTWSLTGSLATICGQPLVNCFADDPTTGAVTNGLTLIHGFPTTGTGTPAAPILRSVTLDTRTATCLDESGPDLNVPAGGCQINVHAQIDFGCPTACGGANIPPGAIVKVGDPGCPNSGASPKGCPMTYNAATGKWDTSGAAYPTILAASGQNAVSLNWATTAGGSNNTFTRVARPFAASDASGPISYIQVAEAGVRVQSLSYAPHNLVVRVGVRGSLGVASSASDPTVILRFASGSGSNAGTLDCDLNRNLDVEIQTGCQTAYSLNTGQACTAANTPPYCIATQTGGAIGQLRSGMNARFAGCPVNRWVPTMTGLPSIPDGDPRLIPLIITAFGAFSTSGTTRVPVINFGAFYVTGWDQGGSGPCATSGAPGNEPFPGTGTSNGAVWGHFMTYVGNFGGETSGGSTCDFGGFALCTTSLVE